MKKNKSQISVQTMVKAGFLVAISIVMTRFVFIMLPVAGIGALRISFGYIPLILSGIMFGPLVAGLTGLAADLIGVLINPQGPYHPGFTLSSVLWGLIPGLVFLKFREKKNYDKIYSYKNILVAVFLVSIIVSLGLDTYWLSRLYGKGFIILLPTRILASLITIPLYTFVLRHLMKFLRTYN